MMDRHHEKHRVDMLFKDLRKVQAYCAGQQQGRHSGKVRIYTVGTGEERGE